MEELAVRASRFVSLLVGRQEPDKQPSPNSKVRRWQLAQKRVAHLGGLLDKAVEEEWEARREVLEFSALPHDPTNPTQLDFKDPRVTH